MNWLSLINALLGIWVGISPWIFSGYDTASTTNVVIAGAIILIIGAVRFATGFASTPAPQTPRPAAGPAGTGMSMTDMVRALVRAPESQREVMLKERMNQFLAQTEEQRTNGMKMMLSAALQLPRSDYRQLAGSRVKVVMTLPAGDQMKLMKTHVAALKQLSQSDQMTEMNVMKDLLMDMPDDQRKMMSEMMGQAGMSMAM